MTYCSHISPEFILSSVGCFTSFIETRALNFLLSTGIYQLQVKGDEDDPKTQVRRI